MTKILKLSKRVVCFALVMFMMMACLPMNVFAAKPNIIIINSSVNGSDKGSNVIIVRDAPAEPKAKSVDDAVDYVAVDYAATEYVAQIGGIGYESLQAAINEAVNGNVIELLADCAENVTVTQAPGVEITIDGKGNTTFTGAITVDGKSAAYATAGLTIQNIKFDAASITTDACINLGVSGNTYTRYTSNVVVENCTFTGVGQAKVAVKSYTGGDKNLTISKCTVDKTMHSLLQADNITGVVIDGCIVYSKNGINLNSSSDVEIKNSTVEVSGYAVRVGVSGGASGKVTLTGNALKTDNSEGDAVVVIRGTAATLVDLTMTKNVVSGDTHISGTTAATKVSADENYWDGKIAPVVSGAAVDVDTYYVEDTLTTLKNTPKGNDFSGYTSENSIWGEVWGNATESFVIKILDANGNVMGTTSLNNVGGIIDGDLSVTWSLKLDAASNTDEYWDMEWTTAPSVDNIPAKVELWVDGVRVSGGDVVLNAPDNLNKIYAAEVDADGKILSYATTVQAAVDAASVGGGKVLLFRDSSESVYVPSNVEIIENEFDVANVIAPVAQVGEKEYYSVLEALLAAIESGASELKLLKDSREVMPTDIELMLKADLAIVSATGSVVEVKFYNNGTNYDFIFNSASDDNQCTLTIGENVTFQLEDRIIWAGYYGNNVDVVVDGTLAGWQYWLGADTTVTATGTLKTTGEALVMRRGATLTVDSGTVNANYFSILSGNIVAKDAIITSGPIWVSNTGGYANEGAVSIDLNGTEWTSTGNIKLVTDKTVKVNLTNSTLSATGKEYGASQIDAESSITVGAGSQLGLNQLSGEGALIVDVANITSGAQPITGNVSGFTGTVALTGNDDLKAVVDENGNLVIKEKVYVAQIGETKFESLQAAIDAVKEGETIVLLDHITVTEAAYGQNALNHARSVSFTLDLNGKTLSADTGNSVFRFNLTDSGATSDVTVTIKNGKIVSGANTWCTVMASGIDGAKAIMNLEDLTIENNKGGDFAVKAWANGVVNANNVTINASYGGGFYALGGEIVLEDCVVNQKGLWTAPYLSMAFGVSNGGKMTINSGTYTAVPAATADGYNQGTSHGSWCGGIMSSGGTLIINGGTFSNGNIDGTASNPRELLIIGADADYGDNVAAYLEINGGTFNSIGDFVHCETIWGSETDSSNTYMPTMGIGINAGDFTGVAGKIIGGCDPISTGNPVKVEISGGTFSTAVPQAYCADNYVPKENGDGTYGVKSAIEAMIVGATGPKYYESLAEAIAAARDGQTITIMANIEISEALTIDKNLTIADYGSLTITFVGDGAFHIIGNNTLTIDKVILENASVYGDFNEAGAKVNDTVINGVVDQPSKIISDGTTVTVTNPAWVSKIGGVYYMTLEEAFKAATDGCTIEILDDVTIDYYWDCRNTGAKFTVPVTINGNDHTIKFTGNIDDRNWYTVFRFEADTIVKNLTIDVSEATGVQRVISSRLDTTLDNVTIIGGGVKYGVIFGEGAGAAIPDVTVTITNSNFVNCSKGVSDNANAQDVKSVTITGNTFTNAGVNVSAAETITFTSNNVTNGDVVMTTYAAANNLAVTAKDNTLDADKINSICAKTIDAQDGFATPVAQNGNKYYLSLTTAIDKAIDGDVITLLADITLTEAITGNESITIDFNGKTLKGDVIGYTMFINGGVYIAANGEKILGWDFEAYYFAGDVYFVIDMNGNIAIVSGTLTVMNDGRTAPNRTLTINAGSGLHFGFTGDIDGKPIDNSSITFEIYDTVIILSDNFQYDGDAIVLADKDAKLEVAVGGINVTSSVEGYFVTYENGAYVLKEKVAQIGDTFYASLADAFNAAQNGDKVVILKAGTYALSVSGKDITITGAVDGVVFDNIGAKNMGGANVTFNNVTFDYYPNVNYTGLQHSGNLVYNDCTFNGQVFLYGVSETFNNCTFNQNSADAYNVWTYGAKVVEFKGCTFNSAGKSVLIYKEYDEPFVANVTVNDCDFIASAPVAGKAAIEMDSSIMGGINLTIDAATTATGFDNGNVSGNILWNNKNGNEGVNNDITVTVNDVVVLEPIKTVKVSNASGDIYYTSIEAAFEAAKAGDTVYVSAGTYAVPSMKAGVTIIGATNDDGTPAVLFEGTLSGTLENLTLKNIHIKGGNAQRWAYAKGDLVFENVIFEATSVYAIHFDGITEGTNLLYKDCTIIGWVAMGGSPASCVFDGCTIKDNGTYGVIRTYFNTTITNCTFDIANANPDDEYQDGIHSVSGATVTVENCTNVNGTMKDIVNVSDTSVVVVDGTTYKRAAQIGETVYLTLEDAVAAAQAGDEIILLNDVNENVTVPAGVIFNGNGKTVNGTITAGGNLTFKGSTTVSSFSAGGYNNVITIGEGASLKVTGGRVTVSYGNIFNIIGSITDAKTADKTTITPSVEFMAGISFNGNGGNVQFNVTNAYVVLGDSTTKNSGATGKFNINFTNSIVDFTKTLKTYMPTASGLAPEFNLTAKDSVISFASHLELWLDGTTVALDNTNLTVGGSFANAGTVTLENNSNFVVNAPIMSSHGGNTGTINVLGGTFELKDSNQDWENAGTINIAKGGKLITNDFKCVDSGNIVIDATDVTEKTVFVDGNGVYDFSGVTTVNNLVKMVVSYANGDVTLLEAVAQIGEGENAKYYLTFAEALAAAQDGDTITLIWSEGDAPIAMNGAVYGKTVTITGTATVDWNKGWFYIGRSGNGDGTVIFENAKLTSASNSNSYGINVSGRKNGSTDVFNGTLIINNSTIELDYLINKGTITLDNSTLTVKNGFSVGGRPANETESGEDATATITLNNNSKLVVNNHNGMGLGYEAIGVMNVNSGSTFECTQDFLVTAKGTLNVNGGNLIVAGKLTTNKNLFISGESTVQIQDLQGRATIMADTVLTNSYIKSSTNGTTRVLGNLTLKGGFSAAYLMTAGSNTETSGYNGTITIEEGITVNVSYGVEMNGNVTLNGGTIELSGGNASGAIWGMVFQNGTFTINTDLVVDGNGKTAPIHFTNAIATINSSITQKNSGGEPMYIGSASVVTLGKDAMIDALSVYGTGKLILDATDMNAGDYANVKCGASGFTGTLEVINGKLGLYAAIEDGKIVLKSHAFLVNDESFNGTLAEAIAAAKSGDVIVLTDNITNAGTLVINKGITLNLNGYTLEADYLVAFKGNNVVDSTRGKGLLNVDKDSVMLSEGNTDMAVWTEEGYKFASVSMQSSAVTVNTTGTGFSFTWRPSFTNKNETGINTLFADANVVKASGLQFIVRVSWTEEGSTNVRYQDYVYDSAIVANIYPTGQLTMSIDGFSSKHQNVKATLIVKSDSGVEISKDIYEFSVSGVEA